MGRSNNEIFMLSRGSQYFAVPSKLLRGATTKVNGKIESTIKSHQDWPRDKEQSGLAT